MDIPTELMCINISNGYNNSNNTTITHTCTYIAAAHRDGNGNVFMFNSIAVEPYVGEEYEYIVALRSRRHGSAA